MKLTISAFAHRQEQRWASTGRANVVLAIRSIAVVGAFDHVTFLSAGVTRPLLRGRADLGHSWRIQRQIEVLDDADFFRVRWAGGIFIKRIATLASSAPFAFLVGPNRSFTGRNRDQAVLTRERRFESVLGLEPHRFAFVDS